MVTRRSAATCAAVLLATLAGCSREPEPSAPANEAASQAPRDETGPGDAATPPTAAGETQAAADGGRANAIPPALRGRWGLVAADCTSTAGDAKGLLTIGADQLEFYESVARLERVRSAAAEAVDGTFAFTGEGQSWTLDVSLRSPDGGRTLVRKDTGPDAMPAPLTYTRCS